MPWPQAPADEQPAIAEGLFRCAETLSARDERSAAIAIYERLDHAKMPKNGPRRGRAQGPLPEPGIRARRCKQPRAVFEGPLA